MQNGKLFHPQISQLEGMVTRMNFTELSEATLVLLRLVQHIYRNEA
jgi:hypothetical protein